jgi:hypothetical protein
VKATVERDRTTRELTILVAHGPKLDVSEPHHQRPRTVQVDRVRITVVDGQTTMLTAMGGVLLKSGVPSIGQRGSKTWTGSIHIAPEWAKTFWREAPAGVTDWRTA